MHDRALNVGRTSENYRIRELAEIVAETVPGSTVEIAAGASPDLRTYRVDCGRLERALPGLDLRWDARRGARELYSAYVAAGLRREDLEGPAYSRLGTHQAPDRRRRAPARPALARGWRNRCERRRRSGAIRAARRVYRAAVRAAVDLSCRLGWNVARSRDYYSPLPVYSELARRRARWDRPSALGGVAYDLDAMRALIERLLREHGESFRALPSYDELKARGYGPGFTMLDGMFLFLMLRARKPRLFVEVGSGLSTYYASLALARNAAEGSPGEIRCIDPHVRPAVRALDGVDVVAREVQDVEPSFFGAARRAATCCSSTRRTW